VITNFCLGSSLVICNAWIFFRYTHFDRAYCMHVLSFQLSCRLCYFACCGFFGVEVLCLYY
jgi:hypothetical protein